MVQVVGKVQGAVGAGAELEEVQIWNHAQICTSAQPNRELIGLDLVL
jgi:hypothetical protein